jgi:ribosome modulation factor
MVQRQSRDINPNSLEHCPDWSLGDDDRSTLVDGRTEAIPWPKQGFNCYPTSGMAQHHSHAQVHSRINPDGLEHCPDQTLDDRQTLVDGKTLAKPYPQEGFNCYDSRHATYAQRDSRDINPNSLEHCPDWSLGDDDRSTLVDGRTEAIPWPKQGFNCYPTSGMAQHHSHAQVHSRINPDGLEHCPDQTLDDRQTLVDGKTLAKPYPQEGFNC